MGKYNIISLRESGFKVTEAASMISRMIESLV